MLNLDTGLRLVSCSFCSAPPTSCVSSRSPFGSSCLTKWAPVSDDWSSSLRTRIVQASTSSRSSFVVVSAFFGLGGSKGSSAKAGKQSSLSLESTEQTGKGCLSCAGKGAIECRGCKGTGKNKKNGNMFERWKCYDCQGFGLVGCPKCGTGGLTPEQRGER